MEPLNPVEMETQIRKAANQCAEIIDPVSQAYDRWQSEKLALELELAKAFKEATGSVELRKNIATIVTYDQAMKTKDAEVVYRRLSDFQRSYRDKLSALQTLSKSVLASYNIGGGGAGIG